MFSKFIPIINVLDERFLPEYVSFFAFDLYWPNIPQIFQIKIFCIFAFGGWFKKTNIYFALAKALLVG